MWGEGVKEWLANWDQKYTNNLPQKRSVASPGTDTL